MGDNNYSGGGGSLLKAILAVWAAWNMSAVKTIPSIFNEQVLQTVATIVVWYFIIVGWIIMAILFVIAIALVIGALWKLAEWTA